MIAILNFTGTPITSTQRQQIVASIVEQSDERYVCEYPRSRVYDARTVDDVPLTPVQWRQWAVIPFVNDGDAELLTEVNRRRGYEWPVVRVKVL